MTLHGPSLGLQLDQRKPDGSAAPPASAAAEVLALAARLVGVSLTSTEVDARFGVTGLNSLSSMARAAKTLGLKVRLAQPALTRMASLRLPFVSSDHDGGFFLVRHVRTSQDGRIESLVIQRSSAGPTVVTAEVFSRLWSGSIVLLRGSASLAQTPQSLGLQWFIGIVLRYSVS